MAGGISLAAFLADRWRPLANGRNRPPPAGHLSGRVDRHGPSGRDDAQAASLLDSRLGARRLGHAAHRRTRPRRRFRPPASPQAASSVILEDAVKHSPHNVHYWAAPIDASRSAEPTSREALRLNPGDPLLLAILRETRRAEGGSRLARPTGKGAPATPPSATAERTRPPRLLHSRKPQRPHGRPAGGKLIALDAARALGSDSSTRDCRQRPTTRNSWRFGRWPSPCKRSSTRPCNSRRPAGICKWRSRAAIAAWPTAC